MTILGRGDLSPPRRRHRHRAGIAVLVIVLIGGLGAGGYFGWNRWGAHAAKHPAAAPVCHTPPAGVTPMAVRQVRVRVLNGTLRSGLAAEVQHELRRRGFDVVGIGNTPKRVRASVIDYPSGGAAGTAEAAALHEQVQGVPMRARAGGGAVVLVIGPHWHGLTSTAEAARAHWADEKAAHPRPVCS